MWINANGVNLFCHHANRITLITFERIKFNIGGMRCCSSVIGHNDVWRLWPCGWLHWLSNVTRAFDVRTGTLTFNGMCKYCSVINSAVTTYHFLIIFVMWSVHPFPFLMASDNIYGYIPAVGPDGYVSDFSVKTADVLCFSGRADVN